ncbi:MAG: hypothetical protein KAX40_04365 [Herpetosiphon sp.]|nr:hypothetical protein [Herpetosiphon sp.]
MTHNPILIAIPQWWNTILAQIVEHYGVNTIIATSLSDAKTMISTTQLSGVFVIANWVGTNDDATIDGIMPNDLPIPTITFVGRSSDYLWMNAYYKPPQHEYITIPWNVEEVLTMLVKTRMLTETLVSNKEPINFAELIQNYNNQHLLDAINTAYEQGAYPDEFSSSARRQHHRRMIQGEW